MKHKDIFKLLQWRKIFRVEAKKGIYNLTIFQLDATYPVHYVTMYHTVGMNTYSMIHMNQFKTQKRKRMVVDPVNQYQKL